MSEAPEIRITVDGKLAYTALQAAQVHGRTHDAMRKAIQRLGMRPVAMLDDRTPLYPARDLAAAIKALPGHGGRPPKEGARTAMAARPLKSTPPGRA